MARFEEERVGDFKRSLEAFVEGMITRQKTVGIKMAFFRCYEMVK